MTGPGRTKGSSAYTGSDQAEGQGHRNKTGFTGGKKKAPKTGQTRRSSPTIAGAMGEHYKGTFHRYGD
jgi:hypothetical protein